LLKSLVTLMGRHAVLRQRALYQGLLFAAFSLFWTAVPVELARHYGLSQSQIALFALVGAIGAIAAPIAGRLADAGLTQRASLIALILAPVAFLLGLSKPGYSVIGLAITGVLLDFAVQMSMVLGQRAIYALDPASRGRLNALYMTSIFVGGAIGSALASGLYERHGWEGVIALGAGLPVMALVVFVLISLKRSQVD
jgi:predicted MFS family arabinose efflux permease